MTEKMIKSFKTGDRVMICEDGEDLRNGWIGHVRDYWEVPVPDGWTGCRYVVLVEVSRADGTLYTPVYEDSLKHATS